MKINAILLGSLATAVFIAAAVPVAFALSNDATPEDTEAVRPAITTNVAGDYLAGQYAKTSGNIDSAIRSLQRVHREQPDNTSVAIQLQGMLLLQGRVDEVVKLAEQIRASGIKDPLSSLVLVLRDAKEEEYESADAILGAALEGNNVQLWMPLLSGWVAVSRHTLDKPMTTENISVSVGRAAPLVNYHLALINAQAGFKDEAAKNFKNAIDDPLDPPKRVMKQLLKFYDENNSPELLTPLVKAYRDSHPESGKEAAIASIANARDGIAEVMYTMGGIMFGAGVANDAAIYLQLATYIKPDLSEAVVALGDAYGELQQYERSNELYGKIPPQNPYYLNAQLHIAVNYEHMGKLDESLALLDKLTKQSARDPEALVTKGDLLRIHARYPEAVDAYTKALARLKDAKSSNWPIYFARGTCYERQGKWDEAEKDMLMALELKPDQPDVLNYLGFGWLERGKNSSDALAMIQKAIKARPDDAQIVDSMGWALYIQGDYKGSMEYLEKAVELLPGDPTVNDHLGDLYWRLGRKNEARFQWERSLTFSPENKLSEVIQKKLKDGLPPTTTVANTLTSDAAVVDKPVLSATP